jgi:hypothetical protein
MDFDSLGDLLLQCHMILNYFHDISHSVTYIIYSTQVSIICSWTCTCSN